MKDSLGATDPHIKLVEKSIEAHDRYGKTPHAPDGPFKKISDHFDTGVRNMLSDFARKKFLSPFHIEGPYIDYCFDQMRSGVVREVVWRMKSDKNYPIEIALHFKKSFFGLKASHFALRGLKGGHTECRADIHVLEKDLNEAEAFPFIKK